MKHLFHSTRREKGKCGPLQGTESHEDGGKKKRKKTRELMEISKKNRVGVNTGKRGDTIPRRGGGHIVNKAKGGRFHHRKEREVNCQGICCERDGSFFCNAGTGTTHTYEGGSAFH